VAVAGRHLTGQDELQPGIQRLRDGGLAAQGRVLQDQHAAHGFFRCDGFAGTHQEWAHLLVLPQRLTQGVAGCGGTSACSTSHRGVRFSGDMSV
jgi:hypothetical protein